MIGQQNVISKISENAFLEMFYYELNNRQK